MARTAYSPQLKAKLVLEVLEGERELGTIAQENGINPNMLRNWRREFLDNARIGKSWFTHLFSKMVLTRGPLYDAALSPASLMDMGKFEVKTAEARPVVTADRAYEVETRIIDGKWYILIPAEKEIEINGIPVHV